MMGNNLKYLNVIRDNKLILGAVILSIVFLIIALILYSSGNSIFWLLPPALLMAFIALFSIDRFLILTVFLVPLSIQLRFIIPETSIDIFLPTEIMLAGILFLMAFKVFYTREISREILLHPVSIISFCILGWYLITSFTSTLPLVSLKSFIARLWFITGFYLLAAEIFKKPDRIRIYFIAYFAGMIPVVIYYLVRIWQAGIFNQKAAYSSIRPFFNDHTSFGAALAFCIPFTIYLIALKNASKQLKIVLWIVLSLFFAAFIFSYSRAAWLSLGVAALVTVSVLVRISWKIVFPAVAIIFIIISMSWSGLMIRLNENKQESSDNIKSHIQSIANVRSDASNMERINRWKSAFKMFREKPILGWGPATYQFNYAPYQMATDKTIISTNYGEGGNAHSEYFGSMVDSGVPGLILYLVLLFVSIRKGIIIAQKHNQRQIRFLSLALVAGLVTYSVHGALNNFLDTDKISALFWGMIAAITAIDISRVKESGER